MEEVLYETKCKRCGRIEEYVLCSKNVNPGINYNSVIQQKIRHNSINYCEKCEKSTVQEFVSYEIKKNPTQ